MSKSARAMRSKAAVGVAFLAKETFLRATSGVVARLAPRVGGRDAGLDSAREPAGCAAGSGETG